ncbi:proprotein convertase P-domain-containing protein [Solwaraspora sp. WMMA2065]|uniref:proprotein convertase P-domain-containing protein n=1 Tax=Solwaraspora sp. WMMA2065 TaxID=3015166 RepID=UPI00259BB653|nr:proprotein convertase P-domain-containing protein [Solwaraspora sp. WMMA2065]WJK35733.1 proprotein convertase P-domain-containing protein [Solwaraspora sp. WMMA2065]
MTATVSTTTTIGAPHTVTLGVTGLPSGATATFSPSSVTSGGSATLTIATTTGIATGVFPLTVVGTGPETAQSAPFTLIVNGPPGCSQTNSTDVAINDNSTVESSITITGCSGNASSSSTIEVNIYHTWIGDLTVSLIAPDGSINVLHSRSGSSTDNIVETYTRDLSVEVANGTWKLRVQDSASLDTGYLDSWTLSL